MCLAKARFLAWYTGQYLSIQSQHPAREDSGSRGRYQLPYFIKVWQILSLHLKFVDSCDTLHISSSPSPLSLTLSHSLSVFHLCLAPSLCLVPPLSQSCTWTHPFIYIQDTLLISKYGIYFTFFECSI